MIQHWLSTFLLSPGASLSPTKYQAAARAQPALVLHGHLGLRHREEPGVQETVPARWRLTSSAKPLPGQHEVPWLVEEVFYFITEAHQGSVVLNPTVTDEVLTFLANFTGARVQILRRRPQKETRCPDWPKPTSTALSLFQSACRCRSTRLGLQEGTFRACGRARAGSWVPFWQSS